MRALALLLLLACPLSASAAPTLGFVENFPGTSIGTWFGGASYTNPGTGGVDNDGYLRITRTGFAGQLATRSDGLSIRWLNGIMTCFDSGSKWRAAPPKAVPATVMASES